MKVIVGLGNPGHRYEGTRHNVGWWVLDHLAGVWRFGPWRAIGPNVVADGTLEGEPLQLVKPQTFMNLSGEGVASFLAAGLDPRAALLVIVDEAAIPVGRYRLRAEGSSGGHNGLRDIERSIGHAHYARLRIGVGPTLPDTRIPDLAEYVLGAVPPEEREAIAALLPQLTRVSALWAVDGVAAAVSRQGSGPPRPDP